MPKKEYDDERYLEWHKEIQTLLIEFINTEGNTKSSARAEVEAIIEDIEEEE